MNIPGSIDVNKKKYGKYDPNQNPAFISYGQKKNQSVQKVHGAEYEELAGINELDTKALNTEKINSEPLKLELKLERAEKKFKKIQKELKDNKKYEIYDEAYTKKLQEAGKKAEEEIKNYRVKYREQGLTFKMADNVHQAKNSVADALISLKDKTKDNPLVQRLLSSFPGYKDRQIVKKAQMLNKRLSREMSRPGIARTDNIEFILIKAEKLIT